MEKDKQEGTAKTIPELPQGFAWKDMAFCRGTIPMPQDWHFRQDPMGPLTRIFFITREAITGPPLVLTPGALFVPEDTRGFFQTGLTIYVHRDAVQAFKAKPSELVNQFAREFDLHIPESDPTISQEGNLLVVRIFFRSREKSPLGISSPPTKLYIETSGNDSTGTFYMMTFETPSDKWSNDQEIARVMIENRVFAQDF